MNDEKYDEKYVGINVKNPIIKVYHNSLKRYSDSGYKSYCPVCPDGILFMRRDDEGHLEELDFCVLCGQQLRYMDLEKVERYGNG